MHGSAIVAAIYVGCAVIAYLVVERRWRWRWREIEDGRVAANDTAGPFRDGGDVPRYRDRAPANLRLAAFTSLLLGQLFIPFAFAGALTVVLFGLGLLAVPILISTAKLYRAGLTLLRRDPRLAYFCSRDAARWSLAVHAVLAVGGLVWCGDFDPDVGFVTLEPPLTLVLLGTIGALHARWLLALTRRWEDALFAATAHPSPGAVL